MVRALSVMLVAAASLLAASPASAQRATERYIPIGRSPGLSAGGTWLGTVVAAQRAPATLVTRGREGSRRVLVTPRTKVWIDASHLGRSARSGGLSDCREGSAIEVRFEGPGSDRAEWIKVRAPGPGAAATDPGVSPR